MLRAAVVSQSLCHPASSSVRGWPTLLEDVSACPSCHGTDLKLDPKPCCPNCGFHGNMHGEILSLLDEAKLNSGHMKEVEAQTAAVDDYYENENKLTCHWDRISAHEVPELLGWPTGIALDLGCGTGTAGGGLRNAGMKVVGADLSISCLRAAQRRLDAVVQVDAAHLPFRDASFDAIVSRGCLHHLDDAPAALKEASRVLKPGGRALFMDPREYQWLEPIKHRLRQEDASFTHDHHAYTPQEYRTLIEVDFEIERAFTNHPIGILVAHTLDLIPLPTQLPRRGLAKALVSLDRILNQTPLRNAGHLLGIVARKR